MSTIETLTERAAALVAAARRAGADGADSVVVSGTSFSVGVRDGKLEDTERSEGDDLGLRVFLGRRTAIVSTSDPDPAGFAELAARAVAMARVAPEDRFAGLAPADDLARDWPDLDLVDRQADPDAEALKRLALDAEAAALAVPGVSKSGGAGASRGSGGFVLVTSNGFSGGYFGTRFGVSVTAIAGDGVGMERDWDYTSQTHFADLAAAAEVGRTAGERAVRRLAPRKLDTMRVPVIFEHRVATSLVGHLTSAINGAAIARGTSFLKTRRGERVFAPGVRIGEDPLRARGARSRPFDAEGRPTRAKAFVEDGVLATWILDGATARELGLASTGNAERGVGSPPSPSASNVVLEPGPRSLDEAMRAIGTGLLVTDLIGSGANIVTGDYSRGAAGFWIEGGAIAYPVAEITVAGRLDDMFRALEPLSDIERKGSVHAPSVLLGEMTVAGR